MSGLADLESWLMAVFVTYYKARTKDPHLHLPPVEHPDLIHAL
jgi:hypothetical protein